MRAKNIINPEGEKLLQSVDISALREFSDRYYTLMNEAEEDDDGTDDESDAKRIQTFFTEAINATAASPQAKARALRWADRFLYADPIDERTDDRRFNDILAVVNDMPGNRIWDISTFIKTSMVM